MWIVKESEYDSDTSSLQSEDAKGSSTSDDEEDSEEWTGIAVDEPEPPNLQHKADSSNPSDTSTSTYLLVYGIR